MKTTRLLTTSLMTLLLAGLLGACASNGIDNPRTETADLDYATEYRRKVNSQASIKNINVQWVNPPDNEDLDENYESDNGK